MLHTGFVNTAKSHRVSDVRIFPVEQSGNLFESGAFGLDEKEPDRQTF
jgi:hypothetical protein